MEGHGKPRNLDNFAVVSSGISELVRGIWQNFPRKTVGPNDLVVHMYLQNLAYSDHVWKCQSNLPPADKLTDEYVNK